MHLHVLIPVTLKEEEFSTRYCTVYAKYPQSREICKEVCDYSSTSPSACMGRLKCF